MKIWCPTCGRRFPDAHSDDYEKALAEVQRTTQQVAVEVKPGVTESRTKIGPISNDSAVAIIHTLEERVRR